MKRPVKRCSIFNFSTSGMHQSETIVSGYQWYNNLPLSWNSPNGGRIGTSWNCGFDTWRVWEYYITISLICPVKHLGMELYCNPCIWVSPKYLSIKIKQNTSCNCFYGKHFFARRNMFSCEQFRTDSSKSKSSREIRVLSKFQQLQDV